MTGEHTQTLNSGQYIYSVERKKTVKQSTKREMKKLWVGPSALTQKDESESNDLKPEKVIL